MTPVRSQLDEGKALQRRRDFMAWLVLLLLGGWTASNGLGALALMAESRKTSDPKVGIPLLVLGLLLASIALWMARRRDRSLTSGATILSALATALSVVYLTMVVSSLLQERW